MFQNLLVLTDELRECNSNWIISDDLFLRDFRIITGAILKIENHAFY